MNELKGKRVILIEPTDKIDSQFRLYEESGCDFSVGPYVSEVGKAYSADQLIELGNEYDAIIGMSRDKFTGEILSKCGRVQMIGKTGIGVDHIDLAAATEKGILVTNTPGNHELDVAEYAVGEMLLLTKGYAKLDAKVRAGGWRDSSTMGGELYEHTVGLVGYGAIGRHVARRLQWWDCKILAYDPYVSQEQCDAFGYSVKMTGWETLFRESDIVSLHLPLNDKTKGCVGKREFQLMKKNAYIINTSRGPLLDVEALDRALSNKEIAGAAVDTHVEEPTGADYPLLKYDNVIITPHCAGWAYGGLTRIAEHAARNTIEALSGKPPVNTVNPDAIALWRKRFGY